MTSVQSLLPSSSYDMARFISTNSVVAKHLASHQWLRQLVAVVADFGRGSNVGLLRKVVGVVRGIVCLW